MPPLSRRDALQSSVACILGGFAGCVSSDSVPFSSSSQSTDGWAQFQRDASNTGFSSALSAGEQYDTRRWQVEIDTGTGGYGGVGNPTVRDGYLYVGERSGDQYQLTALRTKDATREWSRSLRGRNATPAVTEETVFVSTTNVVETNRIVALATADGSERWHFDFEGGRVTPITYADGRLYVAQRSSVDGTQMARVFALSEDGSELWQKQVEGDVEAPVAVGREYLFVGRTDGKVQALNIETGESEWTVRTEGGIRCAPTVGDKSVFVADDSGEVYAISTDGQQRWRALATKTNSGMGLAVSSKLVFVAGQDGLFALRRADGTQQWSFETDGRATTPAVGSGTIYVGIDDALVAVETESGNVVWRHAVPSVTRADTVIEGVTSAPAIGNDGVYVGTASGLYRFVST